MSKVLITRPEHDPGTRYLSRWSENVIEEARKRNFDVIDLHKDKAIRKEFEGRVHKANPALIVMNGHGNEASVTGHDNEVLVQHGDNEALLHNRVTYAVSCDSAAVLGAECVKSGETAFIGYNKSFIFNFTPQHILRPTQDKRAAQFLNASNQVPISLLKGHTAKQASDRSKSLFRNAIQKLLPSITSDPFAREDAKDLFWDMNHQICLGAQDAHLL